MKILSRVMGRRSAGLPSWAALDEEALRLASALEHLDRQGNLDDFPGSQSERLALMTTASRRRLVRWNRNDSRYELTSLGRQRFGMQRAPADPAAQVTPVSRASAEEGRAWAFSPGALIALAAGAALGAALVAFALGSSYKGAPQDHPAMPTVAGPPESRQDKVAVEDSDRAGQVPARALASGGTDQPAASDPTPARAIPGSSAQLALDSAALGGGSAPAQAPSASPEESMRPPTPTPVPAPTATTEFPVAPDPAATARTASAPAPEGTVERVPDAASRRTTARSQPIGTTGRHSKQVAGGPAASQPMNTRRVGRAQSGTQTAARARGKARAGPLRGGEPQQAWGSGKTLDVRRSGPLVREERKLGDGTVLVRYQYGNGPAHFEKRHSGNRDRGGSGYASGMERWSRFGGFD